MLEGDDVAVVEVTQKLHLPQYFPAVLGVSSEHARDFLDPHWRARDLVHGLAHQPVVPSPDYVLHHVATGLFPVALEKEAVENVLSKVFP